MFRWLYNFITGSDKEERFQVYDGPWNGKWVSYKGKIFVPEPHKNIDCSYRLLEDQYSGREYYVWMTDEEFESLAEDDSDCI